MKITPIEIRQKEFEKVFRGYEKEAVDAYLNSLSVEWERMMDDNKALAKRIEATEKEIDRLREVETSLFRTLKSAEETGNSLIEAANKKSELYVREAQMNSETMLTEASYRAKSMLEEAEEKSKDIIGGLKHDVKDLEDSYHQIAHMKDNLMREIKHVLADFSDKLSRHSETSPDQKEFEARLKSSRSSLVEKPTKPVLVEQPKLVLEYPSAETANVTVNKEGSASFFDQL